MVSKSDLIKYLCQTQLACFARMAFGWVVPRHAYAHHWPLDLLGDVLMRCRQGQVKRLIINTPPRSLKSFYTSVAFPAWCLAHEPTSKVMCIAGNRGLADDQHELAGRLMTCPGYRALFPHVRVSSSNQTIRLRHGGLRSAHVATPGGGVTGRGADILIVDDPLGANYAEDDDRRDAINAWYDQNIYQRLDSKQDGVIIVLMQRLHVGDLTGHLLRQDGWEVLSLPAVAMNDESFAFSDGTTVRRRKGEALSPARESREQLREAMLRMGAKAFMAQYQQAPYPPGQGEVRGGAFHVAPHLDADDQEREGAQMFLGKVPEETFVLDRVFGKRICIRPGPPPPMTREEWLEKASRARRHPSERLADSAVSTP